MAELKLEKQSVWILATIGILISIGFWWNLTSQAGFQNWTNVILALSMAGLLAYESNIKYAVKAGGFRLMLAYVALVTAIGAGIIGLTSIGFIGQAVDGSVVNWVKSVGSIIGGVGVVTFILLAFRK